LDKLVATQGFLAAGKRRKRSVARGVWVLDMLVATLGILAGGGRG